MKENNIYQVIPVGIHNISQSFRPNLAPVRVLFLGTIFIPIWDKTKAFDNVNGSMNSKKKINTKVYFRKLNPVFLRKNFCLKNYFVPPTEYTAIRKIET